MKAPIRLPPLPLRAVDTIQTLEHYVKEALAECGDADSFNTQKALRVLRPCVAGVLDAQTVHYFSLPERQPEWLDKIAADTLDTALALVGIRVVARNPEIRTEIEDTINENVTQIRNVFRQPQPLSATAPRRAPGTIYSPLAARRMEAHIASKGLGMTEFAGMVPTTDRTLRTFRRTGKVRRDIFDGIAKAIGQSRESLLNPE
jgi:hypothetical protein